MAVIVMALHRNKNSDKILDTISKKLSKVDNISNGVTNNGNTNDHDYYLDANTEPPRFGQYRLARARSKEDNITQDELDYYL